MKPDVIVLGAGVAGIAAAVELGRVGWRVLVLEATDRLGGRVFSAQPSGWERAVELGAEFVHGGDARIRRILGDAGTVLRPIDVNMWEVRGGVLAARRDYWERIGKVAGRIPRRDHGWTFAQFLRREGKKIAPADAELARAYVGSFNAAPVDRISAHALRPQRAGADAEDFKPGARYDSVVRGMRKHLPKRRVGFALQTVVTDVKWKPGSVAVRARANRAVRSYTARAVVCTLPLGVLKAGRPRFLPELPERKNLLRRAGWGNVVRIVVRFRSGFWNAKIVPTELRAREGREFGFVTAPDALIPVWWALNPPATILTGWAGGEAADRLAGRSRSALLAAAVGSLAEIFKTERAEVARWIVDWVSHDWRRDPFARGAYSFPVAGAEDIAARLGEPVEDTVFFAGEAFADDFGTVHGAIETGVNAARRVSGVLEQEVVARAPMFPAMPFVF